MPDVKPLFENTNFIESEPEADSDEPFHSAAISEVQQSTQDVRSTAYSSMSKSSNAGTLDFLDGFCVDGNEGAAAGNQRQLLDSPAFLKELIVGRLAVDTGNFASEQVQNLFSQIRDQRGSDGSCSEALNNASVSERAPQAASRDRSQNESSDKAQQLRSDAVRGRNGESTQSQSTRSVGPEDSTDRQLARTSQQAGDSSQTRTRSGAEQSTLNKAAQQAAEGSQNSADRSRSEGSPLARAAQQAGESLQGKSDRSRAEESPQARAARLAGVGSPSTSGQGRPGGTAQDRPAQGQVKPPSDGSPRLERPQQPGGTAENPGRSEREGEERRAPGDRLNPEPGALVAPVNRGRTTRDFHFQDSGASYTARDGDTLSAIVRDALIERHRNPGYTPTAEEIALGVQQVARRNNISSPDQPLRSGQRIEIPAELINRTQAAELQRLEGSDFVHSAGATPEFAREVDRLMGELPPGVLRILRDGGYRVIAAGDMRDYDPALATQRPRGWGPGMTWANADGLHNAGTRQVMVSNRMRDSNGLYVESGRTRGALLHEVGHAVDASLGNFVRTPEFAAAYERDAAAMTPAQRTQFEYLLQGYPTTRENPNYAGRQETFAEVFGAICGSSANASETEATLNAFPNVRALMEARLGIRRPAAS